MGHNLKNTGINSDIWNDYEVIDFVNNRTFTLKRLNGDYFVRYTFTEKDNGTDFEYFEWADEKISKYHTEERCLKQRLRKYVNDHLRFLTDFRIDFINNLAERGLRPAKTKIKVTGGFRNLRYAKCYFAMLSIIQTCRKQDKNIGETIRSIFEGKKVIFT